MSCSSILPPVVVAVIIQSHCIMTAATAFYTVPALKRGRQVLTQRSSAPCIGTMRRYVQKTILLHTFTLLTAARAIGACHDQAPLHIMMGALHPYVYNNNESYIMR